MSENVRILQVFFRHFCLSVYPQEDSHVTITDNAIGQLQVL